MATARSGTMRATTLTYQSYFSLTTMNYTNGTLVFPKFDTADGTLNSVTLTFETQGTGSDSGQYTEIVSSGFLQNSPGAGGGAAGNPSEATNLAIGLRATLTVPEFSSISVKLTTDILDDDQNLGNYESGTLAAYSGTNFSCASPYTSCPGAGSDTVTWSSLTEQLGEDPGSGLSLGTASQTVTTGLAAFEGAGNYTISDVSASGNYNGSLPVSFIQNALTQSSVVADITYNYTAAPEPATFALFGSALAGLIAFRKKFAR